MFTFVCNICGASCSVADRSKIERETPTCQDCGSNARIRWVVHALSMGLFGESLVLPDFPVAKRISGIGMSDWGTMARLLPEKLDYANTFYHMEPKLDITRPGPEHIGRYDFVIASEVFEHVPPPIGLAFENLARLLKPRGFVVFSVPWMPEEQTREHFPDLHDWRIEQRDGRHVLLNTTADGRAQFFDDLVFHGGPGQTLEMRLFSRPDLLAHFRRVGLTDVRIAEIEENPRYGILCEPWSRGMVARRGA